MRALSSNSHHIWYSDSISTLWNEQISYMYKRIFITLLHLVLLQQICKIVAGNEKLFEVDEQVCNCVHQEEEQTTPVSMGLGK